MEENTGNYQGRRVLGEQQENKKPGRHLQGDGDKTYRGFWKEYGYLVITAAVVLIVFRVLLQLAYVPSSSMESIIPRDSLLVSWQLPYLVSDPEPERGDIVTLWNGEENKLLVKRVIGLPGEEITFSEGYVCVDGQRLEEPYLDRQGITTAHNQKAYQVPEGCLLFMGDNRGSSKDSRFWTEPYIPENNVRARVMICIPLFRWHNIPLPQLSRIHLVG